MAFSWLEVPGLVAAGSIRTGTALQLPGAAVVSGLRRYLAYVRSADQQGGERGPLADWSPLAALLEALGYGWGSVEPIYLRTSLQHGPGISYPYRGSSGSWRGCASPARSASWATACATAGATWRLKTDGMTYSGCSSSGPTTSAIALAAASFMPSVMTRAPQSSTPRKSPGKQSTLLIWLG